jgi:hypothetical protein
MRSRSAAFLLLVTLASAVVFVAAAPTQDATQPDLDGTWFLNAAKSKIAKHGAPHGETLRIESSAEYVIISEAINGTEITRTYNTDGKISPVARVSGGAVMAKAYWKKSALVIETFGVQSSPSPLPPTANPRMQENPAPDYATNEHTVQRLTVSADGKTLTRDFGKGNDVFVYNEEQ